jgi:L-lactate dehydrogenase complex protein LldG
VAGALAGTRRVVTPVDVPEDWLRGYQGMVLPDDGLTVADLDGADAVLTGCAVAIAETGTIVLDGGAGQGRRALSLVPDHHVCVVAADQVVGTVPAGLRRLTPTRPLTFISGPSATSDIELNRVEGVHGPRRLHVLLVA